MTEDGNRDAVAGHTRPPIGSQRLHVGSYAPVRTMPTYSVRSACMGSTLPARRAGR